MILFKCRVMEAAMIFLAEFMAFISRELEQNRFSEIDPMKRTELCQLSTKQKVIIYTAQQQRKAREE